ncbi:MAG: hypothetical protein IKY31_00180 [Bacteroidaceae bacterium]|nr:hypothetical protein [Bacteroidaceae bacterium]
MKKGFIHLILFLIGVILVNCNTDEIDKIVEDAIDDTVEPNWKNPTICDTTCCKEENVNLLKNGGLERWQTFPFLQATDWLLFDDDVKVQMNRNIVYEEKFSAKMQSREIGSTARIDQLISVYPKQKIRIRFKYYVEQWKPKGARTYCYFRTERAEKYTLSIDELEDIYDKDTYHIFRGGGYGLAYFPHKLNVWLQFDETIEVPSTAHYFVFGINSYCGTTIYIDDCHITDET